MSENTSDFYHKRSSLLMIAGLTSALLALFVIALARRSGDPLGIFGWIGAFAAGALLGAVIVGSLWVLWQRPVALSVTARGLWIPLGFHSPMPWTDIARITRAQTNGTTTQARDWLIITPRPGALAPYRLPVWRRIEKWNSRKGGLRIGLHALEGDPQDIIAQIEQFHPLSEPST